jgi:hypothetical protein
MNKFLTTSQTIEDINFVNKICFKTPPMDNTLPHFFIQRLQEMFPLFTKCFHCILSEFTNPNEHDLMRK